MQSFELSDAQRKQVEGKTPEEILALAAAEGYQLTDEQLESLSGGAGWLLDESCPVCDSSNICSVKNDPGRNRYCYSCGHSWLV